MCRSGGASLTIGACLCWSSEAWMPKTSSAATAEDIGVEHRERTHAADPKHCRGRIADDAAGAAGVRGRDNRREIADADATLENVTRNRRTDQSPGDIVEEGGGHEDQDEEHESAPPIVGENDRHPIGNAACLEMAGQERKAEEKPKQNGKQDPFMGEMGEKSGEPGALVEAVPKQLLDDDGAKTGEGDRERVAVEDGDASERDAEDKKIEHHGRIVSAKRSCDGHAEDPAAGTTR